MLCTLRNAVVSAPGLTFYKNGHNDFGTKHTEPHILEQPPPILTCKRYSHLFSKNRVHFFPF